VASLLVDTGFLVALFSQRDRDHGSAVRYLGGTREKLITVGAVIVETCFFLGAKGKSALLQWLQRGAMQVQEVPVAAYQEMSRFIERYADREVDFADAALVWLANQTSSRRIVTVDLTDFAVYRLKSGKRFEPVAWFG
jgi:uncharacterized protein